MPANSFMTWVTRPRLYAYSSLSTLAALLTVAVAFSERSNFYAAVVFLGRSNGCLLVLLNFLLVIALIAGRILQLLLLWPVAAERGGAGVRAVVVQPCRYAVGGVDL